MTVHDDLATLQRLIDAKPTSPTKIRWEANGALARVEAEIARLENTIYGLRAEARTAEELHAEDEAEVARLRDGNADKVQRMSRLAGERDEARAQVARLERERDKAGDDARAVIEGRA